MTALQALGLGQLGFAIWAIVTHIRIANLERRKPPMTVIHHHNTEIH